MPDHRKDGLSESAFAGPAYFAIATNPMLGGRFFRLANSGEVGQMDSTRCGHSYCQWRPPHID